MNAGENRLVRFLEAVRASGERRFWVDHLEFGLQARRGQTIYDAGDPIEHAYLLVSGTVYFESEGETPRTVMAMQAPSVFADDDLRAGRGALHTAHGLGVCQLVPVSWEEVAACPRVLNRDHSQRLSTAYAWAHLAALAVKDRIRSILAVRPATTQEEAARLACAHRKTVQRWWDDANSEHLSNELPLFHSLVQCASDHTNA